METAAQGTLPLISALSQAIGYNLVRSTNTKGETERLKSGKHLLFKREFHNDKGFHVLHIQKLPCKACNKLMDITNPIKQYVMNNEYFLFKYQCSCGNHNEYMF